MVRLLLLVLLLALRLPAAAQAPAWQSAWAVATATSGGSSYVTAMAVDAAGNVYLAGNFTNAVVLGATTLTSRGGNDAFVAKFSPAGNQFLWAQQAGGAGDDQARAVAVNGPDVYVAGTFGFGSATAAFGPVTLACAGPSDAFVAKLTDAGPTGSFVWAQRAGGTAADGAYALAVNGASVYVAGDFSGAAAGFGATTLASAGAADLFVAKLVDAGPSAGFAWALRAGGADSEEALALAVNGPNVYVAGDFASATAGFGATALTRTGQADVYVAKLADAGNTGSFAWAQRAGGPGGNVATALAVNGPSVYVAGNFAGSAAFGPVTLASAGSSDLFVAKLTDAGPSGGFAWAQRAGGAGGDVAYALAVRGPSVYVAGDFSGAAAGFGATTLANAGAGTADVYVAKLTDAGNAGGFVWAQRAGGTAADGAAGVAVNGPNVSVAGAFASAAAGFGATTLSAPNATRGFVAALADPVVTASAATAGPRGAVALFPNPARRAVTVRWPAGAAPTPLTLTDPLGRSVRESPAPAGPEAEATLDLRGLPAGLYWLRGAGPARRLLVE